MSGVSPLAVTAAKGATASQGKGGQGATGSVKVAAAKGSTKLEVAVTTGHFRKTQTVIKGKGDKR